MKKSLLTILFPVLLTFMLSIGVWANAQQPTAGKPCCDKSAQAAQAVQSSGCENCPKGKAAAAAGCENCVKGGGAGCEKCAKCAACENCAKGGDCAKCEKCAKNGAAGCANCVKQKQAQAARKEEAKQAAALQDVKPCCNKCNKKM